MSEYNGGWNTHETWQMAQYLDNTEGPNIEANRLLEVYAPADTGGFATALKLRFGGAFGDEVDWTELASEWLAEWRINNTGDHLG